MRPLVGPSETYGECSAKPLRCFHELFLGCSLKAESSARGPARGILEPLEGCSPRSREHPLIYPSPSLGANLLRKIRHVFGCGSLG